MRLRWAILALASAAVAAFVDPIFALAILALVLALGFLARNLEFGLLILVFFFPYLGLVLDFGQFEALRDVAYLKNINAPFVDLFGLLLLAAWGLSIVINWKLEIRNWKFVRQLPYLKSYFLFWLSGLVSLTRVSTIHLNVALKYFLRPFTFAYVVFFAMPVSIITRSKKQEARSKLIENVLTIFFLTGLFTAFDGLFGLVFGLHEDFPRAQPFGFFGFNPLGFNHNLLAETLIATAPAGLILSRIMNYESGIRGWIRYGMFFQWAIALLTFSRTAWIAAAVQAMLYVGLMHRGRIAKFLKEATPALILLLAMILVLTATTFTETVRGSTISRLDQIRISTFYFLRSPWIGQGLGTFIPTLWQTRAYLLDYGEPLEAHGVLFKLAFEQGLLGLVTFGFFVGSLLWTIAKRYRATLGPAPLTALLIAAGSLTYQLFNTTYYTSKLWVPLAIAVAIARIMNHESGIRQPIHNS